MSAKLQYINPCRFVVLGYDSIYVYEDEMSRSPKQSVSFLGYKGVVRSTSKSNEWCFTVVPGMESLKSIKFSCVSDRDRREWMLYVKKCLYVANRVHQPDDQSEDYDQLEKVVFEPYVSGAAQPKGDISDDDDDADSDFSDGVIDDVTPLPGGARPISDASTSSTVSSSTSSGATCSSGVSSITSSKTSSYTDVLVHSQDGPGHNISIACLSSAMHCRSRRESEPSRPAPPPPCGRRVVVSDYVNAPAARTQRHDDDDYIYPPSLMEQCSMLESSLSREELLTMLQPRPAGTYFIRKSRRDDRNVLSVNVGDCGMKEMKMWEKEGRFSMDSSQYFDSVEELLKYYHGIKPLPSVNVFLRRGINAEEDEDENIYSEAG